MSEDNYDKLTDEERQEFEDEQRLHAYTFPPRAPGAAGGNPLQAADSDTDEFDEDDESPYNRRQNTITSWGTQDHDDEDEREDLEFPDSPTTRKMKSTNDYKKKQHTTTSSAGTSSAGSSRLGTPQTTSFTPKARVLIAPTSSSSVVGADVFGAGHLLNSNNKRTPQLIHIGGGVGGGTSSSTSRTPPMLGGLGLPPPATSSSLLPDGSPARGFGGRSPNQLAGMRADLIPKKTSWYDLPLDASQRTPFITPSVQSKQYFEAKKSKSKRTKRLILTSILVLLAAIHLPLIYRLISLLEVGGVVPSSFSSSSSSSYLVGSAKDLGHRTENSDSCRLVRSFGRHVTHSDDPDDTTTPTATATGGAKGSLRSSSAVSPFLRDPFSLVESAKRATASFESSGSSSASCGVGRRRRKEQHHGRGGERELRPYGHHDEVVAQLISDSYETMGSPFHTARGGVDADERDDSELEFALPGAEDMVYVSLSDAKFVSETTGPWGVVSCATNLGQVFQPGAQGLTAEDGANSPDNVPNGHCIIVVNGGGSGVDDNDGVSRSAQFLPLPIVRFPSQDLAFHPHGMYRTTGAPPLQAAPHPEGPVSQDDWAAEDREEAPTTPLSSAAPPKVVPPHTEEVEHQRRRKILVDEQLEDSEQLLRHHATDQRIWTVNHGFARGDERIECFRLCLVPTHLVSRLTSSSSSSGNSASDSTAEKKDIKGWVALLAYEGSVTDETFGLKWRGGFNDLVVDDYHGELLMTVSNEAADPLDGRGNPSTWGHKLSKPLTFARLFYGRSRTKLLSCRFPAGGVDKLASSPTGEEDGGGGGRGRGGTKSKISRHAAAVLGPRNPSRQPFHQQSTISAAKEEKARQRRLAIARQRENSGEADVDSAKLHSLCYPVAEDLAYANGIAQAVLTVPTDTHTTATNDWGGDSSPSASSAGTHYRLIVVSDLLVRQLRVYVGRLRAPSAKRVDKGRSSTKKGGGDDSHRTVDPDVPTTYDLLATISLDYGADNIELLPEGLLSTLHQKGGEGSHKFSSSSSSSSGGSSSSSGSSKKEIVGRMMTPKMMVHRRNLTQVERHLKYDEMLHEASKYTVPQRSNRGVTESSSSSSNRQDDKKVNEHRYREPRNVVEEEALLERTRVLWGAQIDAALDETTIDTEIPTADGKLALHEPLVFTLGVAGSIGQLVKYAPTKPVDLTEEELKEQKVWRPAAGITKLSFSVEYNTHDNNCDPPLDGDDEEEEESNREETVGRHRVKRGVRSRSQRDDTRNRNSRKKRGGRGGGEASSGSGRGNDDGPCQRAQPFHIVNIEQEEAVIHDKPPLSGVSSGVWLPGSTPSSQSSGGPRPPGLWVVSSWKEKGFMLCEP